MSHNRAHAILLIAVILFFVGLKTTCREVPLDRVGVKLNMIGGKGVVEKDFAPGYVFVMPGFQRLDLMDPTVQDFTMAATEAVRSERSDLLGMTRQQQLTFRQGAPVNLRTQDEFTVDLDITVLYRIRPDAAHLVLKEFGSMYGFQARTLEPQTRLVIWNVLGQLRSADFYNSALRTAQADRARAELNRRLAAHNLEVLDVLIRNIKYQDEFEQKLLDLQLIDQRQRLAKDQEEVERAKEKTQLIEKATTASVIAIMAELEKERKTQIAATDMKIAQVTADASFLAQKMIAEADSYGRQRKALGELAKTSATAVGDKAVAAAYTGAGAELFLAKQLLEGLQIGDIEINTNDMNPFDVRRMLEMIGLNLGALVLTPQAGPAGAPAQSGLAAKEP